VITQETLGSAGFYFGLQRTDVAGKPATYFQAANLRHLRHQPHEFAVVGMWESFSMFRGTPGYMTGGQQHRTMGKLKLGVSYTMDVDITADGVRVYIDDEPLAERSLPREIHADIPISLTGEFGVFSRRGEATVSNVLIQD
jgi:hypothetical protein